MKLGGMDDGQESGRARIAGTPARQGQEARLAASLRSSENARVDARWPGMPADRELRGAIGMQLGGTDGWNPIEQEGRDARTHGGREARLAASLQSSGIAGGRSGGRDIRWP